jgi:hypothetical protein
MATIDNTVGGGALQNADGRNHYVVHNTVDFSTAGVGVADDVDLINIPANTFVQEVLYDVETEEGSALTADIGENGGDPDGWKATADLNVTGQLVGDGAAAGGKLYTDPTTLNMNNFSGAPGEAVVRVSAICIDVS